MGGSGQGKGPVNAKVLLPPVATAVTTDEIYERYLRKAITEINRLSHEVAQAADGRDIRRAQECLGLPQR